MTAPAYILRWLFAALLVCSAVMISSRADAGACAEATVASIEKGFCALPPPAYAEPTSDREVPICSSDAMSEIAPLPVVPIRDSRLEATGCGDADAIEHLGSSSPEERPNRPQTNFYQAVTPQLELPAHAPSMRAISRRAAPNGNALGIPQSVYRPPRP